MKNMAKNAAIKSGIFSGHFRNPFRHEAESLAYSLKSMTSNILNKKGLPMLPSEREKLEREYATAINDEEFLHGFNTLLKKTFHQISIDELVDLYRQWKRFNEALAMQKMPEVAA